MADFLIIIVIIIIYKCSFSQWVWRWHGTDYSIIS